MKLWWLHKRWINKANWSSWGKVLVNSRGVFWESLKSLLQLRDDMRGDTCEARHLRETDSEDGVRAAAALVHPRAGRCAIAIAQSNQVLHVTVLVNCVFWQIWTHGFHWLLCETINTLHTWPWREGTTLLTFYVGAIHWMLSHFQNSTIRGHHFISQKVLYTLIVDLQVAGGKTDNRRQVWEETEFKEFLFFFFVFFKNNPTLSNNIRRKKKKIASKLSAFGGTLDKKAGECICEQQNTHSTEHFNVNLISWWNCVIVNKSVYVRTYARTHTSKPLTWPSCRMTHHHSCFFDPSPTTDLRRCVGWLLYLAVKFKWENDTRCSSHKATQSLIVYLWTSY